MSLPGQHAKSFHFFRIITLTDSPFPYPIVPLQAGAARTAF